MTKAFVVLAIIAIGAIHDAACCTSGLDKLKRGTDEAVNKPDTAQKRKLGKPVAPSGDDMKMTEAVVGTGVSVGVYEDKMFEKEAGGPIDSPDKLTCSMDASDECCWENVDSPLDQLQWAKAKGTPNKAIFDTKFKRPSRMPDGSYLLVLAHTAASDEAQFSSCAIPCTQSEITVVMNHWQTTNTLLQVCTRDAFNNGKSPLTNCKEVVAKESPGPSTIVLPASKLVNIVIVATNLIDASGDAAIIDNIRVHYTPCSGDADSSPDFRPAGSRGIKDGDRVPPVKNDDKIAQLPSRTLTTAGDTKPATFKGKADNCLQVPCDFENDDLCAYLNVAESGFIEDVNGVFEVRKGQFQNQVTGIPGASSGEKYAVVFLKGNQRGALQALANFSTPMVVSVDHYVATTGMSLLGCCDTPDNCPLKTNDQVTPSDREWKTTKFTCPKETGQLLFICDNRGQNQGACAVDNIHLMVPSTGSTPSQVKLC